jgi:hypothetical protein
MSRDIRSYDSEADIRSAWKVGGGGGDDDDGGGE